ncbi:MAG: ABC transporter substrate-binding protein, partial [Alphaproteobacteria bacterium]|nr:ABC transporter substrate-binding protein [Alphaproteobacteria bacterium]
MIKEAIMRCLARVAWLVALCGLAAEPALAANGTTPIRVGFLTDMSGPSAIDDGPGSITAARMAIADFGGTVLGRPIELLTGDHQNKPDVGLSIAKRWYTEDGVDAIMDVNNSAVALAIQQLTRDQDRVFLITGASSSLLTGKACSPNGVQWL